MQPVAQRAQPVAQPVAQVMPRHAPHVQPAMPALPTSMSRAQTRPAPSCTILLRDLRDLISFDASSRSLPGQALGGKLELDSKLQGPRCLAMDFLHLPTSSYLDVHFSLSVVYKSLSKRPNFSFFFGWARAHKGLHFIPKNRARTQPKQYVFLHGNPLSKIAKYMLYYSFSLGIFHV